MKEDWRPHVVAGGTVVVMLPPGQQLEDREGIVSWSPDPAAGRFTVLSGPASNGDGDELLAAERAEGTVEVEVDAQERRGGLPVRHVRYHSRRHTARVVLDRGDQGPQYAGGEDVESLTDMLFLRQGEMVVRIGYTTLPGAPPSAREALAETLARVRIGDER